MFSGGNMSRMILAIALTSLWSVFALADSPAKPEPSTDTLHLIQPAAGSNGPTVPDAMNERVEQAAVDYEQYAPVPRITLYDVAAPKDADEYAAVDGYGVILVTVLSQEEDELPPKRLYVRIAGSEVELQLFSSGFEKVSGSPKVQEVLGKYRWDGLYYYPIYFSAKAQETVIDYAKNRSGFVIQKIESGDQMLPDWLLPMAKPPHSAKPPMPAFMNLVAREYPGFLTTSASK